MAFFQRHKKTDIPEQLRNELLTKIIPVFMDVLGVSEEKIKPEARIIDDLGADSLDTVELVMGLEEAFEIEITDEDAEEMKIINDVIVYLYNRLKKEA